MAQERTVAPLTGRPESLSRITPSITRPGATVSSNRGPNSLRSPELSLGRQRSGIRGIARRVDHRKRLLDRLSLNEQRTRAIAADARQVKPAVGPGPDRGNGAFLAQDEGVAHLTPEPGIHLARIFP